MAVIPFDQREGHIWFNGDMIPWKDAKVHVLTHGLHYGSSVFEGERAYAGKIFKTKEHTIRFRKSANIMDFYTWKSFKPSSELAGLVLIDNVYGKKVLIYGTDHKGELIKHEGKVFSLEVVSP